MHLSLLAHGWTCHPPLTCAMAYAIAGGRIQVPSVCEMAPTEDWFRGVTDGLMWYCGMHPQHTSARSLVCKHACALSLAPSRGQ